MSSFDLNFPSDIGTTDRSTDDYFIATPNLLLYELAWVRKKTS